MCGILAITGKNIPEDRALEGAIKTLALRGPDDHGAMRFPLAALGHTRLSIIDLSDGGHQPMKDRAHDAAISFNGEIYNYKELRTELEQCGQTFATNSDTEVILKAYAQWGPTCVAKLDGMFAFALWDNTKEQLLLARDRFGKKPLYYAHNAQGTFFVASEIKALQALSIKGEIDPSAIEDYLVLMYVPPWKTVYKNVHTLLPAHYAVYKNGELATARYWQLEHKPISISYKDAKEEVRLLFTKAVRKRMLTADVEVGAFLSGGVDSTLVTAYAQREIKHPIKTFSVGYGEHINELPFAKEASDKIGTDHYTLQANGSLTDELEKVMAYFDEPHADSSNFPQHLLSGLAASKVKVALSGDGADELFLGYGWYWKYWNTRKIVRLKNMFTSNPFKEHLRNIAVFPLKAGQDLGRLAQAAHGNGIEKINLFDLTTYLPGQLLTKIDRTSMMHSLEVRCPFLDYQLAEFVYNLPEEYKTDRHQGKIILKDLLGEIMPQEFVQRRKQGFGAPLEQWLQEKEMRAYVEQTLGPRARVFAFVNEQQTRNLIREVYGVLSRHGFQKVWTLLCLELWLKHHA